MSAPPLAGALACALAGEVGADLGRIARGLQSALSTIRTAMRCAMILRKLPQIAAGSACFMLSTAWLSLASRTFRPRHEGGSRVRRRNRIHFV